MRDNKQLKQFESLTSAPGIQITFIDPIGQDCNRQMIVTGREEYTN